MRFFNSLCINFKLLTQEKVTGLRNPCAQLDRFQTGLMSAVLDRDAAGRIIRKAGVMSVVVSGGVVKIGDRIRVKFLSQPDRTLEKV
jgi:MOSC domain-containing protein YiiM